MIVEGIALVAELLEHPTVGLDVVRTLVPRAAGVPAPPAVTVCDALRHPWVARYQLDGQIVRDAPDGRPLLLVYQFAEAALPTLYEQAAELPPLLLALTYVRGDDVAGVSSAVVARDAALTLRAAVATLHARWQGRPGAKATLVRDGVRFEAPALLRYQARVADPDAALLHHSVFLGLRATDPFALGAGVPRLPA